MFFKYAGCRPIQQMGDPDELIESVCSLGGRPVMPSATGLIPVLHWQPQGM